MQCSEVDGCISDCYVMVCQAMVSGVRVRVRLLDLEW